jgi:hypothetical protein
MRGGIVVSNRLRAMQEAADNFGESIAGIREAQRKAKLEAEDRTAAAKSQGLRDTAAQQGIDQNNLALAELKRRDSARQEAEGFAGELTSFGQAVPESAIEAPESMLPGFQPQQSMRPVSDTTSQSLQDRIRASWMNADAKSKGETAAHTAADVQRKRAEEMAAKQADQTGAARKKEVEDRNYGLDERKVKVQEREAAAKERESGKTQGMKLTEKQSQVLGAAGMAKTMLDDLANQFNKGNLSGARGFAADVVESIPVVGGKLAPKANEYNDKKRIIAETFLREATGAAAPKEEIKFYTRLLPELGDSEEQAQSALTAFRSAVKAKVQGVVEAKRAQGLDGEANQIESRMASLFSDSVNIGRAKTGKVGRFTVEAAD